jgi:hypothetical protein
MTDFVLIAALLAFIALCVAYVGWCDRIIGPDEPASDAPSAPARTSTVGAEAVEQGARS